MLEGPKKNLKDIMGISNEEILQNIKPFDSPDTPATIEDVNKFYAASGGRAGLKGGGRDFEMSDSEKEFEAYKNYLMNEGMIQGDKQLRDQMEKHKKKLMEKRYGIAVANGGRIGYSVGAGKKGVQGLLDLVRNKFGKKSITTADKAPIPPKTLERDMFKKADERLKNKRMLTDDEYQDFLDELGGADQLEAYQFDGTVGDSKRIIKEQKIGRAHVRTPVTRGSRMPSSA